MPIRNEPLNIKVYVRSEDERQLATTILKRANKDETYVYDAIVEGYASAEVLKELYSHGLIIDTVTPPAARVRPDVSSKRERFSAASDGLGAALTSVLGGMTGAVGAHVEGLKSLVDDAFGTHKISQISQDAVNRLRSAGEAFVERLPEMRGGALLADDNRALVPPGDALYEVAVKLPWRPQWRQELAQISGRILCSYAAPNVFRMFLNAGQRQQVEQLPYVLSVEPYGIEKTVTQTLLESIGLGSGRESEEKPTHERALFDLILHRGEDREKIKAAISAMGATTIDESATLLRFRSSTDPGIIGALAARPEVKHLSPYESPSLFVDWARKQVGADTINAAGPGVSWTGEGELIAVFDSGVDTSHEDLADRIQHAIAYTLQNAEGTRSGTVDDLIGHGTHVCGIIAGTGKASNGAVRGIAPAAKLVSIGIVRRDPDDGDRAELLLPADLQKLLTIAADLGAKIINLSWGDAGREVRWDEVRKDLSRRGSYSPLSFQLDQFIYAHPDILVVVAAGNEGAAPRGVHEYNTICSPATAKNGVTVGASGSGRPDITKTYSAYRPQKFADPVGKMLMSSPEVPGALSSRGPTDAEGVKPDITACGVYILSTKAKNGTMGWDPQFPQFTGKYVYLGGTSMAAPVVSGAAAIIRQYLRTHANVNNPSAALLKAILIASAEASAMTVDQGARSNESQDVGYPDFHQGFGRIDLSRVLPHPNAPKGRKLLWDDVLSTAPGALRSHPDKPGQKGQKVYTVTVLAPAGGEKPEALRVVLTWTDPPGQSIQNNLNLIVEGPGETFRLGNSDFRFHRDPVFLGNGIDGMPFDKRNTVLEVLIPAPAAGPYTVRVIAQSVILPNDPGGPRQGFALSVCGTLAEDKLS